MKVNTTMLGVQFQGNQVKILNALDFLTNENRNLPEKALASSVGAYLISKFDEKEEGSKESDLLFIARYKKVDEQLLAQYLQLQNKSLDWFNEKLDLMLGNTPLIVNFQ